MSSVAKLALLVSVAFVLGSCRSSEEPAALRVAAAASLAEAMGEVSGAFERETGVAVELRFGASSTLARQIDRGAPDDVLVSADPRWVDTLVEARLADPASRRRIAANRLVVVVPADASTAPRDATELAGLRHVAVADAEVPAGAHARTALSRLGVLEATRERFVLASDVRATLAWVARGEADAGLVYATDARIEPRVRVAFEIPPEAHDPIVVEAVAITGGAHDLATRFLAFLASPRAQRSFADAGFGSPP